MIAYTNRDVDALNLHARAALDARGDLGAERVVLGGREWAAGDELLCLRNNRALGLANGTRGRVTDVNRNGIVIETCGGERLAVPRDYLERGHATYGWATTGHKAQGITINGEALVLASEYVSREWMYVVMSRAKDASRIYVDTLDRNPRTGDLLTPAEQLDAALIELHHLASRTAAQHLAADLEPDPERLTNRDHRRLSRRDDLPQPVLDSLAAGREQRVQELREQLVAKPPSYLLPLIGPVPMDDDKRAVWSRDAARLEQHRRRNGISLNAMTGQVLARVLGRQRGIDRGIGHDL